MKLSSQSTSAILLCVLTSLVLSCSRAAQPAPPASPSPQLQSRYPTAVDLQKVGKYPALTKSGAGYFYDDVLEYRVWIQVDDGDDYYQAFATYEEALAFSKTKSGAEDPLVLVRQIESVNEPKPGQYVHVKEERITEWQVQWLAEGKREPASIDRFLREHSSPQNQKKSTPNTNQ